MAEPTTGEAEDLLRAGQIAEALKKLQDQVKRDPSNAKCRVFLFQLLALMGQWDRAMTQLNVAAELDAENLLMAQMCRVALNCEALRAEIFAAKRSPLVFGEPAEWVGWLIQANQLTAQGNYKASKELRERAFEAAPAVSGKINETPFQWIADADSRFGPVVEAIVNGLYYWIPFTAIHEVTVEPPADLRDLVWLPVHFTWTNGGQVVGLIPTRYPGSQDSPDSQIVMSRKTDWIEREGDLFMGLGQRMWATDEGEYPLLETRQILFDHAIEAEASPEAIDG